jgi:hypothetical protein
MSEENEKLIPALALRFINLQSIESGLIARAVDVCSTR